MLTELFSGIMMTLPLLVILHSAQPGVLSSINNCLTGGFFFASGRNMINNYALRGHLLRQMTVTQPIRCFEKCQSDCRCISFNYLTDVNKNNCELNEESRYTNFSALKPLEGSQYYDLIVSYDIRTNVPLAECYNGCCATQTCFNGGTCHETCDVTGKRFKCSCKPNIVGKFCETATCSTPGWLRVNNSCYKEFNEQVNWFTAQQACQNLNSNLTSIHSDAENKVIREKVASSIYSRYWIGLNNLRNNSVFEWNDGSSVSFTKWYPDEPNNSGDENCTEVVDNVAGEWNDLNCYTHYRSYVCEKQWNL